MRVRAHAKINLSLEVLNRRPDGFHNLRTVFQTITLADVIDIEATRSRRRTVTLHSDVKIPGENLIVRAAHAVLDALRVNAEVRCRLRKKIPMGGGLGGGSTDAAAVLRVLPGLLGKALSRERSIEIGARLGSDVPVFLIGGTVLGLGRGTELYPLPDLPALPVLVVAPAVHVSTGEAYGALERTESLPYDRNSTAELAQALVSGEQWSALCVNDFEPAVFEQHPRLAAIRRKLERLGAHPARMTGSGSCLFGVFDSVPSRDAAAAAFEGEQVFPVRLFPRSRYVLN
jgi:4-diphosphocytidyl-2-C-methyl-D-erythritol kinase